MECNFDKKWGGSSSAATKVSFWSLWWTHRYLLLLLWLARRASKDYKRLQFSLNCSNNSFMVTITVTLPYFSLSSCGTLWTKARWLYVTLRVRFCVKTRPTEWMNGKKFKSYLKRNFQFSFSFRENNNMWLCARIRNGSINSYLLLNSTCCPHNLPKINCLYYPPSICCLSPRLLSLGSF